MSLSMLKLHVTCSFFPHSNAVLLFQTFFVGSPVPAGKHCSRRISSASLEFTLALAYVTRTA